MNSQAAFEIRMADIQVGHAYYPRPCIVKSYEPGNMVLLFSLSTKDYSERGQSFCIDSRHPDFPATGLAFTSYTIHPIQLLPKRVLKSKRGELVGALARDFYEWLGD
jgi:hypothetical protein